MAETRPRGEQLRFASSKTGEHVLDTYLESVERGTRTLSDLVSDLWDEDGALRGDAYDFRVNSSTQQLEFRFGDYVSSDAGWVTIPNGYLFRFRDAYATATDYERLDLVTHDSDTYVCKVAHTSSTATPDLTKFSKIIENISLTGSQLWTGSNAFSQGITIGSTSPTFISADGGIEISRAGDGAYIDFKNNPAEDYDLRVQATGGVLNIIGTGAALTVGGHPVWHSGNGGPGSSLHADILDGYHAASFALLSGATFTGPLTAGNGNFYVLAGAAANANLYLMNESGVGQGILFWDRSTDTLQLSKYNSAGTVLVSQIIQGDNSIAFNTGDAFFNSSVFSLNGYQISRAASGGNAQFIMQDETAKNQGIVYWNRANDQIVLARFNAAGSAVEGNLSFDASTLAFNNNTVWHAGNDGVGSLLDAGRVAGTTPAAAGLSLLGSSTAAAARSVLGLQTVASSGSATDLTSGTVPAARLPSSVSAFYGITSSADTLPYYSAPGTITLASFPSFARTLVAQTSAAAARSVLGAMSSSGGTFSAGVDVIGNVRSTVGNFFSDAPDTSGNAHYWLRNSSGLQRGVLYWDQANELLGLVRYNSSGIGEGILQIGGSALAYNGHTVWHAGNDGSGSGLDADSVDGVQAAVLARTNATNYFTAEQQIQANVATSPGHYLSLTPTDYGTGKPQLAFKKEATANHWSLLLWDGTSTAGTIDFVADNVSKQGVPITHAGQQRGDIGTYSTLLVAAGSWPGNGVVAGSNLRFSAPYTGSGATVAPSGSWRNMGADADASTIVLAIGMRVA